MEVTATVFNTSSLSGPRWLLALWRAENSGAWLRFAVAAICLRDLQLDLKLPDHIFACKDIAATVCVRNPRRWMPSLSISAVPVETAKAQKKWRWVATTFPVPPWRPPERQWLRLPDRKLRRVAVDPASGVFHESAYFPLLPPGL